jgi:polyribonucleotide 5'-hydroxyl-kinase
MALYSWDGCTLTTTNMSVAYVGKETSMHSVLTLFFGINKPGCRMMIVGQQDSGKSSLCRTLVNWIGKLCVAEKCDPCLMVDIDTNHGSISIAGTVAAAMVAKPLSVQEEFTKSSASPPIAYYYGDTSPLSNIRLYRSVMTSLAVAINNKLDGDDEVKDEERDESAAPPPKVGPIIIDTPAQFAEPAGYELLEHAIEQFKGK